MPIKNPLHHETYDAETKKLINGAAKVCERTSGTLEVGYNQSEEELSAGIDSSGVCYALVKRWFWLLTLPDLDPRKAYTQLLVKADKGNEQHRLLLKEQLISYAFIHRANNYSEGKALNPFSNFEQESVTAVNKKVRAKQYHLKASDLDFISYFGKASDHAVSSDAQKSLISEFCYQQKDFEAEGAKERYVAYVYQHMMHKGLLNGVRGMLWMSAHRAHNMGVISHDDKNEVVLETLKSQEEADADFARQQQGALSLFAGSCKQDALVLMAGGAHKPDHAIGAYLAEDQVLFFDPNFGVFRWAGPKALNGLGAFLEAMAEVYRWETMMFLGFLR